MQAIKTFSTVVLTTLHDEFPLFFCLPFNLVQRFLCLISSNNKMQERVAWKCLLKMTKCFMIFHQKHGIKPMEDELHLKLYDKTWNKSLISWRRNVNIFLERKTARFVTSIKVFNSSLRIFSSRKEVENLEVTRH